MIQITLKRLLSSFFLLLILALASCTTADHGIVLGEGDWDSNAFHDQIAKFIIENGYDVEVNIVIADTAIMISGLKSEDIDASLEVWSDNIPTYDQDIASGEYNELSVNFDDNEQGLYIPRYLQEANPGLVSVQSLAEYAYLFPDPEGSGLGIIYGGPEGWSATEFLQSKIKSYELDNYYIFKTIDSNATLSATLASAYANQEPWVGYNWEPTWIMGVYDMVLLADSAYSQEDYDNGIGSFPSVDVMVCARNGFDAEYPEINSFLMKYQTSTEITNAGLAYMQENSVEAYDAAIWFLQNYEELWSTWVPVDVYDKVKDALDSL